MLAVSLPPAEASGPLAAMRSHPGASAGDARPVVRDLAPREVCHVRPAVERSIPGGGQAHGLDDIETRPPAELVVRLRRIQRERRCLIGAMGFGSTFPMQPAAPSPGEFLNDRADRSGCFRIGAEIEAGGEALA